MKTLRAVPLARAFFCLAFMLPALCVSAPATADELERIGLPVFFGEDNDAYGLAVHTYTASTKAELLKDKSVEHEVEFLGYIRPDVKDDVIGFRHRLQPSAANNAAGDDVYAGDGRSKKKEYTAVLAAADYTDRRGEPMRMARVELAECMLHEPGARVEELELNALAVVAEDRETENFPAVVADRFLDVGHGVQIRVTAMEVKGKGVMTVKLDAKRSGGQGGTIVDALYALNGDGDVIGGGRWINELDIFARNCEYEMVLLLQDEVTVAAFQVVLATAYEVVEVPFVVERLFE